MPNDPVVERVDALEARTDVLVGEVREFRADVQAEFAAVRTEMREFRDEARLHADALHDEAKRHMRVLHEEVLSRIALIGEGGARPRGRKTR